jgi:putative cofactor-binding repeat protein
MKVKFCQEFYNFTISERTTTNPLHLVQLAKCPTYSRKTGLLSYFDAVVDGNDVTNAKPDPKFS